MKTKAMKLSYILPLLMLGGTTLFTGCEQGKDLYNPELLQEKAKEAFPVKDIDPNQTWETSALCNATVSVNEKAGDTYTIKVYTANPYNTNGNAALLATTTVADGSTARFKFDIPAALQQVYVMKVNESGYSAAVPATVGNGILKVDFGGKDATTTRTVMTRNAITRAELWSPKELPTKAPEGAENLEKGQWNVEVGKSYIVGPDISEVNVGKPVDLYISGDVTLKKLWINGDAKIYILPKAKLTLTIDQMPQNYRIGIAKEGELNANSNNGLSFNKNSYLYNCGEINAKSIKFTNDAQFYNMGDVEIEGSFECKNGNNVIQNDGEIDAESFSLEGSSALYNCGKIDIDGHSVVNSNNCVWDNDGTFETKSMEFGSTSPYWINKCKLIVEERLKCQFGDGAKGLIMDTGSYAECNELYFTSATITMGSEAYFYVKGEATFGYSKENQGFIGQGDKPALLKMNTAKEEKANQFPGIVYSGNLYIACEDHFSGKESKYYNFKNGAEMTSSDGADIHIKGSDCNPGYGGTPDGGGSGDKVATFAYGFEDMSKDAGTDYDFNDVVLYVSVPYDKEDGKYVDVTLKAAGASKALSVKFKNRENKNNQEQDVFVDVHTALRVPAGTLVNTGGATGQEVTKSIKVSENFSLQKHGDFYIAEKTKEIHIPAFTDGFKSGDAPYAIRVASSEWKWPKERISIEKAYPEFESWAKDAKQEPNWYNTPAEGSVMPSN